MAAAFRQRQHLLSGQAGIILQQEAILKVKISNNPLQVDCLYTKNDYVLPVDYVFPVDYVLPLDCVLPVDYV